MQQFNHALQQTRLRRQTIQRFKRRELDCQIIQNLRNRTLELINHVDGTITVKSIHE